jgi:hypothetical protein
VALTGDDGVALVSGPPPSIDGSTGVFAGPFPPTDAVTLSFAPLVPRLLGQFSLSATIDSIVATASPGSSFGTPTPECAAGGDPFSSCLKHYLTITRDGVNTEVVFDIYNPWWASFGETTPQIFTLISAEIPFDQDALDAFGIPSGSGFATATAQYNEGLNNSASEGAQNRRSGTSGTDSRVRHGGSRWFSGSNESVSDPGAYTRVGHLDGVDTVWAPIAYTPLTPGGSVPAAPFEKQCFNRALGKMGRAADVQFTWSGGTVTARDVVHNVDVPFKADIQGSFGFLNTDSNGNGFLDWQDFNYIDGATQILALVGGGNCDEAGGGAWDPGGTVVPVSLESSPTLMDVSTQGMDQAGVAGLTSTGTGFGLYVNGERYIFQVSQWETTQWSFSDIDPSVNQKLGGHQFLEDEWVPGDHYLNGGRVHLEALSLIGSNN